MPISAGNRIHHGQSDAHGALLYCVACSLTTRREETRRSLVGSPPSVHMEGDKLSGRDARTRRNRAEPRGI
jgi:hypothetical protein